jgi:uncharacterized RDD family membrane protein YckC
MAVVESVQLVAVPVDERELGDYSGIVTRTIAFVIDALIVNLVAVVVAGAIALGLSILVPGTHKLGTVGAVLAAGAFIVWCFAYWAAFWSTTGQTPGDRIMQIRVTGMNGERIHAVRAVLRFAATILAALPFLLGFVPILLTPKRRALNDFIAHTIVTYVPPEEPTEAGTAATAAHVRQPRG